MGILKNKMTAGPFTRRNFLFTVSGVISSIAVLSPKSLKASKKDAKDILNQVRVESLISSPPQKNKSLFMLPSGDKFTLFEKGSNNPVCDMNMTGKLIWESCDGKRNPKEITGLVHDNFKVTKNQAWNDTITFLSNLRHVGAIL